MFRSKQPQFSVTIARAALESIFDECDQYDFHETGGRLIGTYQKKGAHYNVQLSGVLGPGPAAQRSNTSFFQDGEYQERIFRQIEEKHPDIEHLGNWHTHHVNGLATLSQGDHGTYQRIVNHDKHNTDFFYALLVVRKNNGRDPRYDVKHYFFQRNDKSVYEASPAHVQIVDAPILWPVSNGRSPSPAESARHSGHQPQPNVERAKDQGFFSDFYPHLKPSVSESAGALYWKGAITLIDGSHVKVLTMENSGHGGPFYSITAGGNEPALSEVLSGYGRRQFRSARHAVLHLQADLNQALYRHRKG